MIPPGRMPVAELNTREELERALKRCREQWLDAKNIDNWDMRHWSESTCINFRQMVLDLEARGKALREKLNTLEKQT